MILANRSMAGRTVLFVACCTAVAIIWLIALPRWAETTAMNDRLQWLEQRGIDPSAMYYTEAEPIERILDRQRVEELRGR